MNHYCTYFDRNFLIQGLTLWRSLKRCDSTAVLWVLALDDFVFSVLSGIGGSELHVMHVTDLEVGDLGLAAVKASRTQVEYFFTLSPCWPRWLLAQHPEWERITSLDADLFFFSSPDAIFSAMDTARASVLITAHRFPSFMLHYEKHGRFNVGIQVFRNDVAGLACLDDWRARCLEWCHDRLEGEKYADQKYLDAWPGRVGKALLVLEHPGVNLAPWNWVTHDCEVQADGTVLVDGATLIVFHFARLRPIFGDWWWQSGQLDYGVMPWRLRNTIYGTYWLALAAARQEIATISRGFTFVNRAARFDRGFWRSLPLRLIFGSDWLRVGNTWISGRGGLGRWSGYVLAKLRTIFLRR